MKIEGEHKCEHCGSVFKWYYIAPQRLTSKLFDVEVVPEDKVKLCPVGNTIESDGYRIPLAGTARCPKCDGLNNINIKHKIVK